MSMKLFANENIPLASVNVLRAAGYDVLHAAKECPGAKDEFVLSLASREQRVLFTFDRDYGELIFLRRLAVPLGLIYLRLTAATPSEPGELIDALARDKRVRLEGFFTVLTREEIRQRPFP